MDQTFPEISRKRMISSREGSPSKSRIDNAIIQLARELQQTQKIAENSLHEVHREIDRIAEYRHKTDRCIERFASRIEALEFRCENRVRSIEDSIERVVARLELSLEKTAEQFRCRSADELSRIQSWLSTVVTTFTSQIDECRDRQERDRCAFAEELLGLQEATNERHRALRTIIERQGEAQIAFEKGFRTFLVRYQGEIEDVLLKENTAEKHRLVETRIDFQNNELLQLKSSLEAQIESVSKQDRRRGEALQTGFNSDLESLKETVLTRADLGRVMIWLRQDLIAMISDRQFADSIQNILQRKEPQEEECKPSESNVGFEDEAVYEDQIPELKSESYFKEMNAATCNKVGIADSDADYGEEKYEATDLDEHLNNAMNNDDIRRQEDASETVKGGAEAEEDRRTSLREEVVSETVLADAALHHVKNPAAMSSTAMGDSRLASSSDGNPDYASSFEDDPEILHSLPENMGTLREPDLLSNLSRSSGGRIDDATAISGQPDANTVSVE